MLFRGSFDLATAISHGLGRELLTVYQGDGLRGALFLVPWPRIFATHYVFNMYASSPVWAGVAAGLAGHILGGRRFVPMVAMLLGAGTELGAGYLTAIAGVPPGVVFLLPGVVVTSIATTAVALMVRNAQTEAVRRRVQAAELARAQAELRALRAQINPHFLFNALNTIRYFVRADPETARRLLVDLSEVFQRALRSGEFVPLRDELSYVHAYLSLEQARLGERLHVIRPDPTPDLLDRLVPTLILQPIVENAVVHGVARKPGGGTVWIIVEPADGVLLLRVQDDGPGMSPERMAQVLAPREETQTRGRDGKASTSIGLRNVDGRLRSLYGDEFRLDIKSQPGQGTWVQIRIPGEVS
jgi:sensor histidine kinase YesM